MSNEYAIPKQVASSSLNCLLDQIKSEIMAQLNCVKIGKIESFDKIRKCAKIKLLIKSVTPIKDKGIVAHPVLVECPVFTLQGAGSSLQMPIKQGDTCLVLFADRSLDIWFRTGQESAPADHRMHSYSDAIAIVGMNSIQSMLPPYTDDVVLTVTSGQNFLINQPKNIVITGGGGGDINISNFNRLNIVAGQACYMMGFFPLALLQELNQLIAVFNTHTHAETGVITAPPTTPAQPARGTQKLFGS